MRYSALIFLVIAMVSGVLGFGLVVFSAARIAQAVFVVSYFLFMASLVAGAPRRIKETPVVEKQSYPARVPGVPVNIH